MLDLAELRAAVAAHGPVARVVVAEAAGSAPREAGAAMLVWAGGQSGTIGGGALEWEAAARARAMLAASMCRSDDIEDRRLPPPAWGRGTAPTDGEGGLSARPTGAPPTPIPSPPGGAEAPAPISAPPGGGEAPAPAPRARIDRLALGPALGQCCGGAVTLVTELFAAGTLPEPVAGIVARPLDGSAMPLSVARLIDRARAQGQRPAAPVLVQGWLVEAVAAPSRQVWVWGAGHVGRALVAVLAPLPGLSLTWIDTAPERFPDEVPQGVMVLPAADPALLADHAPRDAEHLILTFSHALDLELCHRLLARGFAACGLIGSATKRARFRARLSALGHAPDAIARIRCPIGDPALGKHPQAIAVGVAADLLRRPAQAAARENAG